MARNLSKSMKRIVAGLCAVLVIAGAVPVQPIADVVRTSVINAEAAETKQVKIVTNSIGSSATVTESVGLPKTYTVQELIPDVLFPWAGAIEVTDLTVSGGNVERGDNDNSKGSVIQIKDTGDFTITFSYKSYDNQLYSGRSFTVNVTDVEAPATATPPTINKVNGATLIYGYSSGSVSVEAEAAEGHTLSYQWYKKNSNSDDEKIEGATSATYYIPTGHSAGKEYYYCEVTATLDADNTKTATETSDVATVTINKADLTAPTITLAEDINVPIITSATVTGGTLYFKVVNAVTDAVVQDWKAYPDNNYTPTDPGTYEVLYYVVADDQTNYNNYGSETEPQSAGYISKMAARELDLKAKTWYCPGFRIGTEPNERVEKLTDLNQGTKFCVVGGTLGENNPLKVYFSTSDNKDFILDGNYTMTTGNDTSSYKGRNPKSWIILGHVKGTAEDTWTTIEEQYNNSSLPDSNWSKRSFTFTPPEKKIYDKLQVQFIGTKRDNTQFQLSEMFFGGKVMKNPSFAFSANSDILFDDQNHAAIEKVGDYVIDYNTVHFLYKKDDDETWTKCTGTGLPQFKDAGTYKIAWYSDIDYTNAYYASGSASSPNVIGTKYTIYPKFDMTDKQEDAEDGQVMKAITKIEYNNTEPTVTETDMEFLPEKEIKITSNSKLTFKQVDTNGVVSDFATAEDWNESEKEYYYTFTIPTGVNIIKAYRVYRYEYSMLPGDAAYKDTLQANDNNNYVVEQRDIAMLRLFDCQTTGTVATGEYIKKLKTRVDILDDTYELPITRPLNEDEFEYFKKNDQGNYVKVTGVPSDVGEYRAQGTVNTNGVDYHLEREFKITARPYDSHKTEIKPVISKIGSTDFTDEAERKVIYSGDKFTPVITVTDTPNVEADDNSYNVAKTLVRGTDYDLGYMDGSTFVKVEAADDVAQLGQTAAGTYEKVILTAARSCL